MVLGNHAFGNGALAFSGPQNLPHAFSEIAEPVGLLKQRLYPKVRPCKSKLRIGSTAE